ncbi:MAG: LLM class flavin-dependent oxidoreductase [Deltaproteobacteria bacterium]|nr:LLM class flavin-dependent oxidoreductase [Deltaproteobacteria bacterium]
MSVGAWRLIFPEPGVCVRLAQRLEEAGWDGAYVADSQNLTGDVFIALAQMAAVTERLGLATGVTNPVTRHPAVAATAIATVNEASHGRAVLGVGRGDSALFQIGLEPAPVAAFETFLRRVRGYLRREEVDVGGHASRLRWLDRARFGPVPVDVAATGARVISVAARVADRISLAVGADPERLRWAMDRARAARAASSLAAEPLTFGCYVNVAPHEDVEAAIESLRGGVGAFAHFSGMAGSRGEGQKPEDRAVFQRLHDTYERDKHTMNQASHSQALDRDFIRRFAIVGPPQECIRRLREITATGVERLVVIGPSLDADPDVRRRAEDLLRAEILPALHEV